MKFRGERLEPEGVADFEGEIEELGVERVVVVPVRQAVIQTQYTVEEKLTSVVTRIRRVMKLRWGSCALGGLHAIAWSDLLEIRDDVGLLPHGLVQPAVDDGRSVDAHHSHDLVRIGDCRRLLGVGDCGNQQVDQTEKRKKGFCARVHYSYRSATSGSTLVARRAGR